MRWFRGLKCALGQFWGPQGILEEFGGHFEVVPGSQGWFGGGSGVPRIVWRSFGDPLRWFQGPKGGLGGGFWGPQGSLEEF